MDIFALSERVMRMDDSVWLRHANGWSVWTRVFTPLAAVRAGWSRVRIGGWALVAAAAVLLWVFLNPRLLRAPTSFTSWAARGVLGERVFLRHRAHVAPHHQTTPKWLAGISGLGILPYASGHRPLGGSGRHVHNHLAQDVVR